MPSRAPARREGDAPLVSYYCVQREPCMRVPTVYRNIVNLEAHFMSSPFTKKLPAPAGSGPAASLGPVLCFGLEIKTLGLAPQTPIITFEPPGAKAAPFGKTLGLCPKPHVGLRPSAPPGALGPWTPSPRFLEQGGLGWACKLRGKMLQ